MEKTRFSLTLKKLLCTLLVLGFFGCIAVGFYYFANIRYDLVYGIYDSMTGKAVDVTDDASPETVRISVDGLNEVGNIVVTDQMLLVNAEHRVDYNSIPELTAYGNEIMIAASMADALSELSAAVKDMFGVDLLYISGYRTKEVQATVLEDEPDVAADVGASEHETGLAIDIGIDGYKQRRFIISDVGKWVNENCWKYGFVIRYPYYARSLTGIAYEPWHLRYVGIPHAGIMTSERITLEEYTDGYFERTESGFVSAYGYIVSHQKPDDGFIGIPVTDGTVYVSPDNCGGYFIWTEIE